MNKNEKCKSCWWLETENNQHICGYVAEVYHIRKVVCLDETCSINKFRALTTSKSQNIKKMKGKENESA